MSIRAQLATMESVEDLFSTLDVPFDEHVVAVHRMRILRRFGREMNAPDLECVGRPEAEVKARFARILSTIHDQCARGMREVEPVFGGVAQQLVQLRRGPPKRAPDS